MRARWLRRIEGECTLAEDNSQAGRAGQDKGTFVPLIFGGAVAMALGFFAGQIDAVERFLGIAPEPNPLEAVVSAQADQIDEQSKQIAELLQRVDSLPSEIPEVDLSGIEGELAVQTHLLDDVSGRLTTLEKRPMTDAVSREAIAAYEGELARLQESVKAQRQEIEALLDETRGTQSSAEQRAKLALARAAMARIIAAVDTGETFAEPLAELRANSDTEVPEALASLADQGVPTLAAVQDDFSDRARAALAAARKEEAASGSGGLGSFLQRQLGARSVTPQDGDDPDAVLSRAEDAVKRGRLADALAELDALPESGQTQMAEWIESAQARAAAVSAADDLMTALSTN